MTNTIKEMPSFQRWHEMRAADYIAVPAAVNVAIGVIAYLRIESGIAGTPGALLVIAASVVIALAALIMGRQAPGALRTTLAVLLLIGILLTALAGWMLNNWPMVLMMGLSLLCWIYFIMVAR